MKLLAIDSSGLVASVAVATEEALLAEYTINYKKTHSQTLLPMLAEIVKMVETPMSEIDAIAVAAGPGSFTGLRIGSATAKGLGLALDKPIVPVPTLEALAYNLYGTDRLVCPMMDARRNQVYTGLYEFSGNELITVREQAALAVGDILGKINELGRKVIFVGDGVKVNKSFIEEELKVDYEYAPVHLNLQRAGSIAALGIHYYKNNRYENAAEHSPIYLRPSQAERERARKAAAESEK